MSNPIAVPGTVVATGSLTNPGGAQGIQGIQGIQGPTGATGPGANPQEVGTIKYWPVATPPQYWLNCDGSQISRTTYAALYTLIGTTFGPGDGSTTFNLPDLRGRVGVGIGQGSSLTNRLLAALGGEENHVLSIAELASHTHVQNGHSHSLAGGAVAYAAGGGTYALNPSVGGYYGNTDTQTPTNQNTGSGTGHNTMPPFLVINFIIKVTLEVALNNPVAPIADTTTSGLVNKLSGNSTDYVGGDNACHPLSLSFPVRTYTANGLAPGVNQRIQIHDDFSWYVGTITTAGNFGITSPFHWYFSGTGTGASIASQYTGYGTQDSFNKCYGVLGILTGAASGNSAYIITTTQLVYAGLGALDLYYRVAFVRVPTAADNFNFQFGLVDAPSTFANSIAIYPTYDAGLGAPCWQGYTGKASAFSYTAKSTTPAIVAFAATSLTYYNVRISINAAWTVVSFYVNGTQIGTGITTNIPTAVQLYHTLYTSKTAGSSVQGGAVIDDYFFDYQYALP